MNAREGGLLLCREELSNVLLAVQEAHFDAKFTMQILCQVLRGIHAAVLTARATKGKHQIGEVAVDITLYVDIGQAVNAFQEIEDFAIFFQEVNDGSVQSRQCFVGFVATGIVRTATVENIATAISAFVGGNAFFIRKTKHAHHKRALILRLFLGCHITIVFEIEGSQRVRRACCEVRDRHRPHLPLKVREDY